MKDKKGQTSFYIPPWVIAVIVLIIIVGFAVAYLPHLMNGIKGLKA